MFLRLERQAPYITEQGQPPLPDFGRSADAYTSQHHLRLGRLSPLGSESLGAPITRILTACSAARSNRTSTNNRIHNRDITLLQEATQAAIDHGITAGGDEALYGRIGLLWAILNLRQCQIEDESFQAGLGPVFENLPRLVDLIVDTGKLGAHEYGRDQGRQDTLPLMWKWHDRYYLGA